MNIITSYRTTNSLSARCLKLACIYFAVGLSMGMYMGMALDFTLRPVHAHINLLGWVSLALASGIFALWPNTAKSRLATFFFWTYNISLPVSMLLLGLLMYGVSMVIAPLKVANAGILVGGIAFALNIWFSVREQPRLAGAASLNASALCAQRTSD